MVSDLKIKVKATELAAEKYRRDSEMLCQMKDFLSNKLGLTWGELADDTELFEGFLRNGIPEFWGNCTYGNCDFYSGGWRTGKPSGFGRSGSAPFLPVPASPAALAGANLPPEIPTKETGWKVAITERLDEGYDGFWKAQRGLWWLFGNNMRALTALDGLKQLFEDFGRAQTTFCGL
ncbi:hypothetical protein CYMTET_18469 [Cymbomonas tetramitiformis]|uniref:Uncharacterized protein n=1 Tax=Cymbomonas tetramitiformis TaxID=36881 RepID=A0AAE0G821_9CHLO|nr:hypothetical protein CYMTET_18469 [Cymbomonas tetramitiformis]